MCCGVGSKTFQVHPVPNRLALIKPLVRWGRMRDDPELTRCRTFPHITIKCPFLMVQFPAHERQEAVRRPSIDHRQYVRHFKCSSGASVCFHQTRDKGPFTPAIYLTGTIAWTFQSMQLWIIGTQRNIDLSSAHKSWPNSKYECTHLVSWNLELVKVKCVNCEVLFWWVIESHQKGNWDNCIVENA